MLHLVLYMSIFVLGLRIRGQEVSINDEDVVEIQTQSIFGEHPIKMCTIVYLLKFYSSDEDVDNFCRLHICLAFEKFYFPKTLCE